MILYVARHGQTIWNEQNRVCGITDIDLTEKGKEQANALVHSVDKKNIHMIISSPLNRAIETSRIVSDICHIPMEIDKRLIEQNYGIYEGVDRKNEAFLENKRNFAYKYPSGESMMQVAYRVYGLLDEIIEKYSEKNILLICHGGVCRIINTYFEDMTNDDFFHYTLANGQLKEYQL